MKPQRRLEHDLFDTEPRTQTINQKRKGINNERVAAKFMQKWTGKPFARVPSSGGLRWASAAKAVGDIVCEDASFHEILSVETKHLNKVQIRAGQLRQNSRIATIWEQADRDAKRAERLPFVLLRLNKMIVGEYHVFVSSKIAEIFVSKFKIQNHCYVFIEKTSEYVYGFHSKDLLEKVNYHKFAKEAGKC